MERLNYCLQVYKFSNSQSKSVILHRMYFHCRSLKQSERKKCCQLNKHKLQNFIVSFLPDLTINSGLVGLTTKSFSSNSAMREFRQFLVRQKLLPRGI